MQFIILTFHLQYYEQICQFINFFNMIFSRYIMLHTVAMLIFFPRFIIANSTIVMDVHKISLHVN